MAWNDVCRVNFASHVQSKKAVAGKDKSAKQIIREISKEVDIPAKTLERWWYEDGKERRLKNEATKSKATEITPKIALSKSKMGGKREGAGRPKRTSAKISQRQAWETAEKNLDKLVRTMMERCKVPADIPESGKLSFRNNVIILNSFVDDL
jgi:hypothetical protein